MNEHEMRRKYDLHVLNCNEEKFRDFEQRLKFFYWMIRFIH